MSVAVKAVVRLRLPAGKAAPSPAIGQALGPLGLNMAEFCRDFNGKSSHIAENTPTPVLLTAFTNRTYEFQIKTPPTAWLIKRVAGLDAGASKPGKETVGQITVKEVYEIARLKQRDAALQHLPVEGVARSVASTARTMGVQVVREIEDSQ